MNSLLPKSVVELLQDTSEPIGDRDLADAISGMLCFEAKKS